MRHELCDTTDVCLMTVSFVIGQRRQSCLRCGLTSTLTLSLCTTMNLALRSPTWELCVTSVKRRKANTSSATLVCHMFSFAVSLRFLCQFIPSSLVIVALLIINEKLHPVQDHSFSHRFIGRQAALLTMCSPTSQHSCHLQHHSNLYLNLLVSLQPSCLLVSMTITLDTVWDLLITVPLTVPRSLLALSVKAFSVSTHYCLELSHLTVDPVNSTVLLPIH